MSALSRLQPRASSDDGIEVLLSPTGARRPDPPGLALTFFPWVFLAHFVPLRAHPGQKPGFFIQTKSTPDFSVRQLSAFIRFQRRRQWDLDRPVGDISIKLSFHLFCVQFASLHF